MAPLDFSPTIPTKNPRRARAIMAALSAAGSGTLADWFRGLGKRQQTRFVLQASEAGITMTQFWTDAAPGAKLNDLTPARLDWYATWFTAHGFPPLWSFFRQETAGTPMSTAAFENTLDDEERPFYWHSKASNTPTLQFYTDTAHGRGLVLRELFGRSQAEGNDARRVLLVAARVLVQDLIMQK